MTDTKGQVVEMSEHCCVEEPCPLCSAFSEVPAVLIDSFGNSKLEAAESAPGVWPEGLPEPAYASMTFLGRGRYSFGLEIRPEGYEVFRVDHGASYGLKGPPTESIASGPAKDGFLAVRDHLAASAHGGEGGGLTTSVVAALRSRHRAGESVRTLAYDYGIEDHQVRSALGGEGGEG